MKYTDIDDAMSLAHNTECGLGGIVFGNDQEKALEVATTLALASNIAQNA